MILGVDVGQKNLGVCVIGNDIGDKNVIHRWAVWESTGSRAQDLVDCLNKYATEEFLQGVTDVVIERQPSKNPTMTRIQHYLEFYFAFRRLRVFVQDPKHKLLYASTTRWFPSDATDKNWTYRHRKNLSVQTAAAFVAETDQPLRQVFEASKKKDDLADALWHAMAFATFPRPAAPATPAPKKIVARAPTEKQRKSGKLSAPNVKYLLKQCKNPRDAVERDKTLGRAVAKHFGSLEECLHALGYK